MKDWNVVVTVYDARGRRAAKRGLGDFGTIHSTDFFNVLVMRVADISSFVEDFAAHVGESKALLNDIARLLPAQATFDFSTIEEFQAKAEDIVLAWAQALRGKSFHVRLNRRGLKGVLSSQTEERILAEAILARTVELGLPARVTFADPDYVIDVETVGNRAGVSLWARDQLDRYPFLRIE